MYSAIDALIQRMDTISDLGSWFKKVLPNRHAREEMLSARIGRAPAH
jgi:hypothetical protein